MISCCDSQCQTIENPADEAVLQVTDAPHIDIKDQRPGTCVLCREDNEHKNDSIISDIALQLKEPRDQDYVDKIEEFEFYLKMVRKMARPGCCPERLDVVLRSMSSLVDTLSLMSSIRSSL